jgi:hypothetical protein
VVSGKASYPSVLILKSHTGNRPVVPTNSRFTEFSYNANQHRSQGFHERIGGKMILSGGFAAHSGSMPKKASSADILWA